MITDYHVIQCTHNLGRHWVDAAAAGGGGGGVGGGGGELVWVCADVDPLDPTRLAPQVRTTLILEIDISFNNCGDDFHRVEVGERVLGSL
ncbi:unnamed protein product [Sphagnum troendelagicum]